jgi:acylphosphatase
MAEARAHIIISGRVQGVFYRAFTRELALNLDLNGWVRNLYDGNVEAVFEGEKHVIEQAIKKCHIGPPGSRVTDIEVHWETFVGDQKGFMIRY